MRLRTLGDHVRRRRLDLGLSLKGLARTLSVDAETVTNWEQARRTPAIRFLPAIFSFLGYQPLEPAIRLGDRLRQAREASGLSRRELGWQLGLDEGTVARIERGTAKRPTRTTLVTIARLLAGC